MPTVQDLSPIQWFSLLVILGVIVQELYYIYLVPSKRLLSWVMIFWMLHGAIYYICIFMDVNLTVTTMSYVTWSSILRLHGYLTIFGITFYRILLAKLPTKERRTSIL